jgi:2-polyprenyl-3-methyl-5-hydroxy-6-metoxy-1,4-benzoquinol methylase
MVAKKTHKTNLECRICKSKDLVKVLTLGPQPLANAFMKQGQLADEEAFYPLDVNFCKSCNLVQLADVVDKEVLYRDYVYFTSGMPKISDHFREYAEGVMKNYLKKNDFVVEIASNDGVLLNFFKEKGYKILGVEPALNIAKVAQERGVDTLPEFFSEKIAKEIAKKQGKAKAILANNVVAHIDDHHDLCRGVKALLAPKGIFVLEAPYLVDMFENLTFDTIYHEHLSYLAIRPLQHLFEQYNLEIVDVQIIAVQGMSIRVYIAHKGDFKPKKIVRELTDKEIAYAMDKLEAYEDLSKRIENSKKKLMNILYDLKGKAKRIAGYGAPAKGNTLLNYYGIGPDILDFALEDLPAKHNMFSPGMRIPVVTRDYAVQNLPDYYLLLAWNYKKPILEKEGDYIKNGGKFIIPVGDEIEII